MPDEIDTKILSLLQNDAKLTIRDIADQLSLTTTPVHERIKKLEKEGVIIGYRAIIDPEKVDKSQVVLLNLHMEQYTPKNIAAFEKMVHGMPQVLECFHLAGTVDYQLKVVVRDIKEYDKFLMQMAKVPMVSVVSSMIVLHRVKQITQIPL
ncbi:MAG: Lrp/AsnC family transcriptional regulator [Bacteroidetes bacterium]|nr:Lrp/AsnC family transcriptional regulator [Bacteroidota bacterium]